MSVYRLSDLVLEKFVPTTSIGGTIIFANGGKCLNVSGRALPAFVGDTIVTSIVGKGNLGKYCLKSDTWSNYDCTIQSGYEPSPRTLIQRIYRRNYSLNW